MSTTEFSFICWYCTCFKTRNEKLLETYLRSLLSAIGCLQFIWSVILYFFLSIDNPGPCNPWSPIPTRRKHHWWLKNSSLPQFGCNCQHTGLFLPLKVFKNVNPRILFSFRLKTPCLHVSPPVVCYDEPPSPFSIVSVDPRMKNTFPYNA